MIVTLKDGSKKEYSEAMSVIDIAKDISEGLARNACAGEINGKVVDLRTVVSEDCNLNILTFNDEAGKKAYWHTTSHVLAEAVKRLYPDAKLTIGPSIDEGFYYDFDCPAFDRAALDNLEQLTNASEEDFKELKTGFRAPYIMDAIRRNMAGQFDEKELRGMDYESCVKELMTIKGVGEKVANCVSLFGLGKKEAFPVDVWIKRIMETMYFDGVDTPKDKIAAFAKEQFGELGGFAQQYLFYYGKTIKMGVK